MVILGISSSNFRRLNVGSLPCEIVQPSIAEISENLKLQGAPDGWNPEVGNAQKTPPEITRLIRILIMVY